MKINNSALRPVRGFVGEIAAARAVEVALGAEATVSGGSRRSVDVEAISDKGDMRVDAKALVALSRSEAARWGCTFQFARDQHRPFDVDEVTHVALVDLERCTPVAKVKGDQLTIDVNLGAARVSLLPVAVVNSDILDPAAGRANRWRYAIVDDEFLDQYRVC